MTRILVVEDSITQAQHLEIILHSAGFTVELALDGQAGLDRIRTAAFDLVITDIVMPGLSGYELCRRIKADPARRHIPVVLLTILSDPLAIIDGIEAGADQFIPKPYEPDRLLDSVRTLLANQALRSNGHPQNGLEAILLGRKITITAEKEQLLDLLVSTCQELFHTNQDLLLARDRLDAAAQATKARADRAKAWLAAIVESSADAIVSENLSGSIVSWNAGAERLFGYTSEEVKQKSISLLVPPELTREMASIRDRLQRGERIDDFETVRVRKDGSRVNVSLSASPVIDGEGGIGGAAKIFRDITDRKRADTALRVATADADQALARLRAVFSATADGLLLADGDGNLLEWNPTALRLHGYDDEPTLLKPLVELKTQFVLSLPGGPAVPFEDWPLSRVLRGEHLHDYELHVLRVDVGREWFISYSGTPIRDAEGRIAYAVLTLRDVGKRPPDDH